MEGKKHIPIGFSKQAPRLIVSIHGQSVSVPLLIDPELKPRLAGQLHLGPQKEHGIPLEVLDPPEIDDIADSQTGRASSSAHGSDA